LFKIKTSCKFTNSILENKANGLVNDRVHNTSNCVNTTDNSADADEEINEGLLVLGDVFGDGRELKVEHQNALAMGFPLVVGDFVV